MTKIEMSVPQVLAGTAGYTKVFSILLPPFKQRTNIVSSRYDMQRGDTGGLPTVARASSVSMLRKLFAHRWIFSIKGLNRRIKHQFRHNFNSVGLNWLVTELRCSLNFLHQVFCKNINLCAVMIKTALLKTGGWVFIYICLMVYGAFCLENQALIAAFAVICDEFVIALVTTPLNQ